MHLVQTCGQHDAWSSGSDVRVYLMTHQNLPGLPAFTSEAATKSLGRPGDEAMYVCWMTKRKEVRTKAFAT